MATDSTPAAVDWYSRPLKRWTEANVNLAAGLAEFARKGYSEFGLGVTEQNVARLDGTNGLYRGMVTAWTRAVEELPNLAARYYDDLMRVPSATPTARAAKRARRPRTRPKAAPKSLRSRK